jgi:hypothetical protein
MPSSLPSFFRFEGFPATTHVVGALGRPATHVSPPGLLGTRRHATTGSSTPGGRNAAMAVLRRGAAVDVHGPLHDALRELVARGPSEHGWHDSATAQCMANMLSLLAECVAVPPKLKAQCLSRCAPPPCRQCIRAYHKALLGVPLHDFSSDVTRVQGWWAGGGGGHTELALLELLLCPALLCAPQSLQSDEDSPMLGEHVLEALQQSSGSLCDELYAHKWSSLLLFLFHPDPAVRARVTAMYGFWVEGEEVG